MENRKTLSTRVVIAGGGPAGMMCGFLLARAGIDTVVLEKHKDFFRDFRGDTVHPATLNAIYELGLFDAFRKVPHQELRDIAAEIEGVPYPVGDFRHLPGHAQFIAIMPQWDFLNFLAEKAKALPHFRLLMEAKAVDLLASGDRVTGLVAETPDGPLDIAADLVIGADGRHSTIREKAGFKPLERGVPIDVLWLKLPRQESDPEAALGRVSAGLLFVMIDRGTYWQCAFVVPKNGFEAIKAQGIEKFRARLKTAAGFAANRIDAIASFDDVSLLTVAVDRLPQWARPGLLCIGDAAHAMSPVGGIGINLAIQDAIAAANLLWQPLLRGKPTLGDLNRVQARREFAVKVTQGLQVAIQNRIIAPTLASTAPVKPPFVLKLLKAFPILRTIPAYMVGIGVRPEHIHAPDRANR
ncbi:MAG: FAD-dependent oxidoreductase [Proteobacteria bacterium]|nr:FAD-dependent oxidoreductase [Pseudomonadota bacterium]